MKTPEKEVMLLMKDADIYADPKVLVDFYKKIWNEAIDAASMSADVTTINVPSALSDYHNYPKFIVDKQSILKLKK